MCWPKLNDRGPRFGNIFPDVSRSRRVRELIWECDLYEATCPSVLKVLLVQYVGLDLAGVEKCSIKERTEVRVLYMSCGVERRVKK